MSRTPHSIQPIIQLSQGDCAITALAMLLNKPYRYVADRVRKTHPEARKGMYTEDIIKVAKRHRVTLKLRTPEQVEEWGELTGIVTTADHAAVIFQGVIIDPSDGQLWDLDTWLATNKYTIEEILEVI